MLYQIKSYLQFLTRATNQHSVHSPFVYDLVTKCFYDTSFYSEYEILDKHRQQLLQSSETIIVKDFGAGSRVFKENNRKVHAIAKNAGVTRKRQQLLFRLARYFQPNCSLELGTSLGLGSIALALGNSNGKLHTVEGCPETSAVAATLFKSFDINNINLHNESFDDYFRKNKPNYDLVYIDGNHSKEHTLRYFAAILDQVHNHSIVIFDDIYWSSEMTEAWNIIKEHPMVSVSIDTFQWGLISFRKEQVKEHFSIRL